MAAKKEKKVAPIKQVVKPKKEVKKPKVVTPTDPKFFAKDAAERLGLESFEFFLIKRHANIQDDTPVTIAEMRELFNKIVEEGR